MNLRNCFRLLVPTFGIAMSAIVAQGCANAGRAPFHMYDSPLLEGRVESRYPRSRSFDPLELGDHMRRQPNVAYAQNDAAGDAATGAAASNETRAPAPKAVVDEQRTERTTEQDKQPKAPSLATRRQAPSPSAKGAPAKTEVSARPSSEADQSAEPVDTSDPALAADYVWSVYKLNGVEFSQAAKRSLPTLFRECKKRGKIYHSSQPAVGDIVFFHNTDDYNGDGRNNDWYTHAAIVESHEDGGRLALLGYRDGEVHRFMMDLQSPDAAMDRHGETANAQLRPKRAEDPPFTQYLAGQLFAGTCSVLGDRSELVVIDNWKPGMKLER